MSSRTGGYTTFGEGEDDEEDEEEEEEEDDDEERQRRRRLSLRPTMRMKMRTKKRKGRRGDGERERKWRRGWQGRGTGRLQTGAFQAKHCVAARLLIWRTSLISVASHEPISLIHSFCPSAPSRPVLFTASRLSCMRV